MNKPHKWAEVIKAKADGKVVQVKVGIHAGNIIWQVMDDDDFFFHLNNEYRIKPEPVYPVTRMTAGELRAIFDADTSASPFDESWIAIANATIRRAIQDGDVVLPGEKE